MTRVTENSSTHSIKYSVGKSKAKVEDLQIKGSNLKRIQKPSDDPIANVDLLAIRSQNIDAQQYTRNLHYAQNHLNFTETVVEELTDILTKAKELAIAQSSDIYNPEVREGVSKEIHQLRLQVLSLANKRVGNRYLFAGQKVLSKPFDQEGRFYGDNNKIFVEINKDVMLPINLTGGELFFSRKASAKDSTLQPLDTIQLDGEMANLQRTPASESEDVPSSIFGELEALENALLTNNPDLIQSLLEKLDGSIDRVIAFRTQIGALSNNISNAENNIEKNKLINEEQKSKLEDADVAELFSNLEREQAILKATYRSSAQLMNTSLMDFLR